MAGLVPAIHVVCAARCKGVDARDKPGHDELNELPQPNRWDTGTSWTSGKTSQENPK
jgi:hypothetical protein